MLRSHIRISMNVGLTAPQVLGAPDALAQAVQVEAAGRLRSELGEGTWPAAPAAEQQITRAGAQASRGPP